MPWTAKPKDRTLREKLEVKLLQRLVGDAEKSGDLVPILRDFMEVYEETGDLWKSVLMTREMWGLVR